MEFPDNTLLLSKLYINGIRNLVNFRIDFNDNLNILVGPNGVGKSTILKIITDLFSNYYYGIPATYKEYGVYDLIVVFKNFLVTQNLVDSMKLNTELRRYNSSLITNDFISDVKNIVKTLNNYNTEPNAPWTYEDIKQLIGHNISIVLPILSDGNTNNDIGGSDPTILVSDNNFYCTKGFHRAHIHEFLKGQTLNFNEEDVQQKHFISQYVQSIQSENTLLKNSQKFQKLATQAFNKFIGPNKNQIEYTSIPEMKYAIKNEQGTAYITNLSSGEKQLELLKMFLEVNNRLKPKFTLLDEPEIHLNYANLSILTEILQKLSKRSQVFVASHSNYFIRSNNITSLKYIRFDQSYNPKYVPLINQDARKPLKYPDIFFAQKIIFVEDVADAIFIERTISVILRDQHQQDLSAQNIQIIPTFGKAEMKSLISYVSQNLGIKYIIIADFDFIINETHYNFLPQQLLQYIKSLTSTLVGKDTRKTINNFKKLSNEEAEEFLKLTDKAFERKRVNEGEVTKYHEYKNKFEDFSYDINNLYKKFISNLIIKAFRFNHIWLLNKSVDSFVPQGFKRHGKLSVDELQKKYYPTSINDIGKVLSTNSLKEFVKLSKFIVTNLY